MPGDDDIALDEKRVYGGKRSETTVYVAGGLGLTRVAVAGDQVGRFELASREPVRDIAGREGRLLVGTPEDVLVGTEEGFEPTGFGPAAAVGLDETRPTAASPDGDVAVLRGDEWAPVGAVDEPRAIDGDLLAAGDGVYRVEAGGASRGGDRGGDGGAGGLDRLRAGPAGDVAAGGPYAASPDGLYELPDQRLREGEHTAVAADTDGNRAHAVAGGDLFVRRNGWERCDLPTEDPVVDVGYGESVYAVTAAGTLLVRAAPGQTPDGHGGWRSRALGVREVRRLAVP